MFYTLIYGCIDVTSGWQIEHPTSNLHSLTCHHYRHFLCASQSLSYSRCWKVSTFLTKGINITEAVLTPWIHLTALNSPYCFEFRNDAHWSGNYKAITRKRTKKVTETLCQNWQQPSCKVRKINPGLFFF